MQTNKQTKCFINISRYRTNTISKRNMPTYNAATLIIVTLAKLCCCKSFCSALLLLTECANNYAVNKQSTCLCRSFCEQRAGSNKPATSFVPCRRSYRWAERNDRCDIGLHMSTRPDSHRNHSASEHALKEAILLPSWFRHKVTTGSDESTEQPSLGWLLTSELQCNGERRDQFSWTETLNLLTVSAAAAGLLMLRLLSMTSVWLWRPVS